jgi:membrane protease YdiL (CAAX protease family)
MTPLWLAVWIGAFFLIIWLTGNVFGIEQVGSIDFTYDSLLNRIEDLTQGQLDPEALNIPSVPVVLALVVAGGIIAGGSINLLFALGEEIGWRGLAYKRLERHGVHARNMLTGFAWGLWHAPLILMGHNFPGEPVAGVFMMVLFCIALSYPMDWLRKHSNTVLAPAAFHGMINGSAAGLMLFVNAGHELIGSVVGLAGLLAVLAVYLLQNLLSRHAGG